MSDRSELMKWVLRTWDFSNEGRFYLDCLLQPEIESLDGGSLLRESVLDVMEDDEQLNELRKQRTAEGLEGLLRELPENKHPMIREHTEGIRSSIALQKESIREQENSLREIRHILNMERIEVLRVIANLQDSEPRDELLGALEKVAIANEVASSIAALSRTRTDSIDINDEWQRYSDENPWTDSVNRIVEDPGEDEFDNHREKFDRFYARHVVLKLDGILDRVAILMPVALSVKSNDVKRLYQEAHDAFLFGFDAASIALCRSLVEHALKDKLSITSKEMLDSLIEKAGKKKLLTPESLSDIRKIQRAGNDLMHNLAKLQHTAQEVLGFTRRTLNELYG